VVTEREIRLLQDLLKRRPPRLIEAEEGTPRAAVATVLRPTPTGSSEVLLIRRSQDPRDPWSGHMAFPGGRADPADEDLLATARRETAEEVGLHLAQEDVELLGRLDDVQAMAKGRFAPLIITPYVFRLRSAQTLHPNPAEVEEALWADLAPMLRGESATTKRYEFEGRNYELPGYEVGNAVVWGLTFHMLQLLFALMRGEEG
jgi:8-oxo-dGTP pyrophosphatase MutT (NUDIX family)